MAAGEKLLTAGPQASTKLILYHINTNTDLLTQHSCWDQVHFCHISLKCEPPHCRCAISPRVWSSDFSKIKELFQTFCQLHSSNRTSRKILSWRWTSGIAFVCCSHVVVPLRPHSSCDISRRAMLKENAAKCKLAGTIIVARLFFLDIKLLLLVMTSESNWTGSFCEDCFKKVPNNILYHVSLLTESDM